MHQRQSKRSPQVTRVPIEEKIRRGCSPRVARMKRTATFSVLASILVMSTMFSFVAAASTTSRKAEVALAREALVVHSDFPNGWTTSPYNSSGGTPGLKQIATCLHVPVSVVNYNPPEANSPYFNDAATGVQAQDSVDVFPNVKTGAQQFNLFASAKSLGCFVEVFNSPAIKSLFTRQIGKGSRVGTITGTELARPALSNESNAFVVRIPGTYRGVTLTIELEVVTIMSKSLTEGAQMTFDYSSNARFPASLISHLEAITVERLG